MGEKRVTDYTVVDPAVLPDDAVVYTVLPSEVLPEDIERHFTWLAFKNWLITFIATATSVVLNTTHRTSDGNNHLNVVNTYKGLNSVVLTNYDTTGIPAIAANSVCEINGLLYINPIEVVISGATADTTWYDILLTPSGTTFIASYIARDTGVWSDTKYGLYSGNNRVVACVYRTSSTVFINKNILIVNNRNVEIKMEIGDWNMNTVASVNITHGIADIDKVRRMGAIIRADDDSGISNQRTPLETPFNGNIIGHVLIGSSSPTTMQLARVSAGIFDGVNYDKTPFNRGPLYVTYEV